MPYVISVTTKHRGGTVATSDERKMRMKERIICSKCNGSGRFQYKSGVVGFCYQCNGRGQQDRYATPNFKISIEDGDGQRFEWLHITGKNAAEAKRKARKVAERGIYAGKEDTIIAEPDGVTYTYRKIN